MNSMSKGENHAQNSYWPNFFMQKKSRSYKKLLSVTHPWSLSTKFVVSHIMLLSFYINQNYEKNSLFTQLTCSFEFSHLF